MSHAAVKKDSRAKSTRKTDIYLDLVNDSDTEDSLPIVGLAMVAATTEKPYIHLDLSTDSDTECSLSIAGLEMVAATTPSQPVLILDSDSKEKVYSLFIALTCSEEQQFYHILNHLFNALY